MHRCPAIIPLALAPFIAALGACATEPSRASWLDAVIVPPTQSVASEAIYPDVFDRPPITRRFADDSGTVLIEDITRDEVTGLTRLERRLASNGVSDAEILARRWLSTGPNGEVLLHRSTNPERDIEIVYEPPLAIAPAVLKPGVTHESDTAIRSFETGGSTEQQTGSASYTLELLGERGLGSQGREAHTRSTLTLTLGRSVVTRRTDRLLLIPRTGAATVLREQSAETVRVFGLIVSSKSQSLTLVPTSPDSD